MSGHEVVLTLIHLLSRNLQVIYTNSYQDKAQGKDNLTLPE